MTSEFQYAIDICPSQPDRAFKLSEELLEKSVLADDTFKAKEAKMIMAHAAQFLGQYSLSYQLADECLLYFEQENAEFQIGYVLNTFGFIFNYFEDHKSRLEVNLKSLELRKKTGDLDGFSRSLNNTGDTFIRLGQYENAIPYLKQCLEVTPIENTRMICVANSNLGEAYFYLGNCKTSEFHFNLCLNYSRDIQFDSLIFNSQLFLGMIFLQSSEFKKAKDYFDQASHTVNLLSNAKEESALLHKQLGNFYEQTKDYREAVIHFKAFYSIEEKIKSEKQQKEIRSIQQSVEIKELKSQNISLEAAIEERTQKLYNTLDELRAQELLNSKILNSAKNAIIVFDQNGEINDFNPSAKYLFKLRKGDLIYDYLKFNDHKILDQVLTLLFSSEASELVKFEFEMSYHDGAEEHTLDVTFTQIEDDKGQKGICFINDITIQVRAEKERKKELETEITINYFAQSLFKANSVDDVLWGLAKDCISRLEFVDCVIYLIDEEKNELVQKAAHGPKNPIDFDIQNPITIPIGQGIVGSVAKTGIAEIISNTAADDRYIVDDDMRLSEIAVPIKLSEKIIGVIDSEHPEKNFYTDRHLRILTTISKLVANRIDKLKEQEVKEQLQQEIIQINESLEKQVFLKTKENIKLNQQIADTEKSLLMAEMSSLLAHEINTPLANIQNSTKALKETIEKHSTVNSFIKSKDALVKEELITKILESISKPSRLISTKKFINEEKLVLEIISRRGYNNLLKSSGEIIKLDFVDEKYLHLLNEIDRVDNFLKEACYEKSVATFISILLNGVDEISRVVEEVKTLKSLELNSNIKKEIIIYDTIIENLKQNFQDVSFSSEDKNLIVLGYPEKLVQLLNGIWKITEDFGTIDHNKTLNFKTYIKDSNVILKLEIPTTNIDTNFFNYSTDFNSYAGMNHSLRVRLSILKSILEEHNAKLAYDIKNEFLIYRIEFSTKDAKN
jgi:PAS domain S-box-containing protein